MVDTGVKTAPTNEGIQKYYITKIEEIQVGGVVFLCFIWGVSGFY